jgi:UDP-N-acetyl-D-galactosamine dehydrogenase
MGKYIASEVIKLMIQKDINIKDADILILGITFKENCPDVRNTKVVDVINALKEYNTRVTVFDPWANSDELQHEYGLTSIKEVPQKKYDSIILTVAHNEFKNLDFEALKKNTSVIYDVKNSLEDHQKDKGL